MSDKRYTIVMPGACSTWFSGCGICQGEVEDDDPGARSMHDVWHQSTTVRKRGKGASYIMEGLTLDGVLTVAYYADYCIGANCDQPDYSEVHAARTLFDRCAVVLHEVGYVWNGVNWHFQGERVKR